MRPQLSPLYPCHPPARPPTSRTVSIRVPCKPAPVSKHLRHKWRGRDKVSKSEGGSDNIILVRDTTLNNIRSGENFHYYYYYTGVSCVDERVLRGKEKKMKNKKHRMVLFLSPTRQYNSQSKSSQRVKSCFCLLAGLARLVCLASFNYFQVKRSSPAALLQCNSHS